MTRRKKAGKKSNRLHAPVDRKPMTRDPSLEEIWGTETTIGLAEQIRLERPEHPENKGIHRDAMIRECSTQMLPGGRGVLRGQG
jgi:hypothetical protein